MSRSSLALGLLFGLALPASLSAEVVRWDIAKREPYAAW